jgi:uncharacterized damage-inducible protein DinB
MNTPSTDDCQSQPTTTHPAAAHATTARVIGPIVQLLHELASVINSLSDEQYVQNPAPIHGFIGAHVRHSLDHVQTLLDAAAATSIDFDTRQRGTSVETSRAAALDTITRLIASLQSLSPDCLNKSLDMSMMVTADDLPLRLPTSFLREAGFVVSHTVHHNAIISTMIRTLGGTVPPRFGYAPSTLAHQKNTSCAR